MNLIGKKIIVKGRVQGVGFRYATRNQALKIGEIYGWVKNMPDQTVQLYVEGEEKKVDDLIAWCYRGSTLSEVNEVIIAEFKNIQDFSVEKDFLILK